MIEMTKRKLVANIKKLEKRIEAIEKRLEFLENRQRPEVYND